MILTEDAVVEEISPVEFRLFDPNERVVEGNGDGDGDGDVGEAAFDNARVAFAAVEVVLVVVFGFNSPSGIVSSFSLVAQLQVFR